MHGGSPGREACRRKGSPGSERCTLLVAGSNDVFFYAKKELKWNCTGLVYKMQLGQYYKSLYTMQVGQQTYR